MQKYESGTNRIGSSRLWDIATLLETPVSFFFDGLQASPRNDDTEPAFSRRTLQLARMIELLPDDNLRRSFVRLIEACTSAGAGQDRW